MVIGGSRAVNDYAGNGGEYTSTGAMWGDGTKGGIVVRRKVSGPITLAHILDGSSNTLLAGEKRIDTLALGTFQCDDNEGHTSGWDWDIIRWSPPLPPPVDQPSSPLMPDRRDWDQCELLFGSAHSNGAFFVLCDGSVRMVSFDIDNTTFNRLCRRDDGGQIKSNW